MRIFSIVTLAAFTTETVVCKATSDDPIWEKAEVYFSIIGLISPAPTLSQGYVLLGLLGPYGCVDQCSTYIGKPKNCLVVVKSNSRGKTLL
jgi:hypothetical protein